MLAAIPATALAQAYGIRLVRADMWAPHLTAAAQKFDLLQDRRQLTFWLAQIGHESSRLVYTREVWGPTDAQKRYEGRVDLGNTQPGDGFRFRGRGLIQITGRFNTAACGLALNLPLLTTPELLEAPAHAAMSAGWYWHHFKIAPLAAKGHFSAVTKAINGGYNGLRDREALRASCEKFFPESLWAPPSVQPTSTGKKR
jgi:putative chitinase